MLCEEQSSDKDCYGTIATKGCHGKQEKSENLESCCAEDKKMRCQSSIKSTAGNPKSSCCSGKNSATCGIKELPTNKLKESFESIRFSNDAEDGCGGDNSPIVEKSSCCSKGAPSNRRQSPAPCKIPTNCPGNKINRTCQDLITPIPTTGSERYPEDPCCEGPQAPVSVAMILTDPSPWMNGRDLEKAEIALEHVVLSVEGMTCAGCEKKLSRSIKSLQYTHNITTSLLMAQAQFDIDVSTSSLTIDEVILSIQKMTGFTCTRISQSGQEIDVIVKGSLDDFIYQKFPLGVLNVTAIKRSTARIIYNPAVVGARDLLSKPFFSSTTLAPPAERSTVAADRAHFRKMFFMTIFSAILTIPVLVLAWAPLRRRPVLYGSISLGLATIIQVVVVGPFYPDTLKALIYAKMIEMDLIVVLSTSTAYIYSVVAFVYEASGSPLATGEFFETSTLLVTLIMTGRAVSAFARQKALETVSIESLRPRKALLFHPEGNEVDEIDARLLQYGDRFKVLPDMKIVTDGMVEMGETEVDESMVTGEATPIVKTQGSSVIAGSVNSFGTVVVKLTRLPGENSITVIGSMLDEAKFMKPKIQQIADRVASYFIPTILAMTAVVFIIWIGVGKALRYQNTATAVITAMTYAISALIVSCPCAIGLAVPMVVVVAGGVAAKHGVIVKSASAIEVARKVAHVVFDKTGTLTQGSLSVVSEVHLAGQQALSRSLALGLMINSKHPVSSAIVTYLKEKDVTPANVESVVSLVGKGVEGTWNRSVVCAGNPRWLEFEKLPSVQTLFSSGLTILCLSLNEEPLAIFGLEDPLRRDVHDVITKLQARNISVSLVSGDNHAAVSSLAHRLGIPGTHVRAHCSPADKQHYIQSLSSPFANTDKNNTILFCGDGTNDAIALAQASIGVHMSGGTDIASHAADAVLLRPTLSGILVLMDLSAAFYRRVCLNFLWAFVYNSVAVLLAAGAFVHVRIAPQYAGLGELVSVLPVVAIAMQLRWAKFGN